jgi:hypothetical protein
MSLAGRAPRLLIGLVTDERLERSLVARVAFGGCGYLDRRSNCWGVGHCGFDSAGPIETIPNGPVVGSGSALGCLVVVI